MELEPTIENLSEAFGFSVSSGFETAIRAAVARAPQEPYKGLDKFGLTLGGPLSRFVGGSAQSLRGPQTPPEFFPFASRTGSPEVTIGFLVDSPSLDTEPVTLFAICVPECPHRSGVVARDEQELFRWLGAHIDNPDDLGICASSSAYQPAESRDFRDGQVTYKTADQMGVVVPPENAPLELLHEQLRCGLIEKRNPNTVRDVGMKALQVGAPGAALALARDLNWWLGHRDHWYQLATELYESAYAQLDRPVLTRIARQEWARLYGRTP